MEKSFITSGPDLFGGQIGRVLTTSDVKFLFPWRLLPGHYFVTDEASVAIVNVVLLFYVHSKHLRSCWDGQLT